METENPSKQMTWNKVFVQIDLWGFFIYWNSIEQKVVTTVDLMYIEDIEMCTDSDDLFESMETSFIRLQVSSEGLFESRATMAYGKLQKGIYDHSSIVFLLVKDNPETLKLWKDNLLRLVFTHYPTRVDLAPLELLWKQWTHLIIVYSNLSTWRKTQQPIHDRKSTISNCCILAAFGLEGNLLPSHRSYLSECSPINTDNVNIDHSSSNANIEETLLDNFTFDVFFDLFIHSWPREDIAELFSAYTKTKGFMNYQELNSFLHTSISYFTNSNVSLENSRNFKAVDKQKTLRHIKYLHLERTQNNQTPIKMKSFQKSHSRKSQNNSSLKRSKSCYTTNQTDLNQSQNLDILNLTSESLSSTTSPLHHNRNRMNDHKSISSLVSTNYKEFSEIVRRYETNQYAVSKCLLTNEGFYRLLLSSTYRELCVSRNPTFDTYDQTTESMSTVAEPSKCSLDESQHPLAHYYIKSAYLTHKTYSEDDIENTVQCNQVSFADTKIPKEPCSVIGYGIKSNKILRTIRQALLFGIRLVGTETIISNELIIVPTNSNKVPTCFTERTSQDSFDLMRSILYKNYPYVLFKRHLPSPEMLKNKILLSIRLVRTARSLSEDQSQELVTNKLQSHCTQTTLVKNPEIASPLTVFITNPEGERKSASQDIASTNSSSQLSPPAKHRLDLNKITDKSATPEDHNSNGWLPKCCGMYTNKIIDRNTAFSSQDEVSYLHPRLARLVVLPTPGFPPDTCIALHYQYLLRNSKSNFMDFDDKHFSESNILRRLQIRRKSEGPIHDSRCFKNMDSANIDKSDQQPDRKLEEGELLTSLFNLITTRKAQLKHRDRKRRLLKRLITEVCGNVANQKRSKSRENNTPSSNRKYAWSNSSEAQTTKVDYQTDKITTKQDEGWFKNRICASPTKPEESNISSKDTLLAATVRYARRLSNASVSRFNLSANSSSRNSECRDASMDSLNNQKHQQHLNNRWDADGSKRSADIYEDKEQNYNDFITKTSSLPMKKELKQNNSNSSRKSSKPQNPKQTKDLSDHISKRRPRKSTEEAKNKNHLKITYRVFIQVVLFRSVGCQLIPYGLDISVTTHDLEKPVSVRQQFMKLNQMDELRNSFAMSENGYILKPALLRIPTINRYHRKLITRRKYQKLFPKSDPNSNNMRNQLSSYLRCACCYDPLDMSSECELIGKIYDGITNLNWPTTSSQEANFYLPWNYTLQLINFMKIHSLHPERSLLNRQESMETQSYQYNTVKPNKLPKRYRRAANATNTTPRRQRHASASRAAVVRNGASFKNFQSTPIKANSWGLTQVRHQSQENVNLNNRNIDFHERRRLNPLKRNYENIIIEAEIKAPLFKFSHLTTNISSRFCQVPEEHNIVRYCLYSNNSSFSTDDVTANNQYTLRKSKTLSRSSYVLSSMLNDKERIPMFSSFNSITRCNSELMLDWLSTRKVTFSRIHLPESICIRINTESHRKECDNDVKSYENMGNVIASCIINSNSPLNKALTGFQHFQLKLFGRYKTKIIPREKKDDVSEFIHSVFHERLKATIVNMDTYVPHSLGDLIETLTRKYDTRLRTIPSNQQTNDKQCSANRSKSYLYLDRHQSIKEISTLKQSIIRSNSFTYKEYGKNLQQNAT
ncbi:hypothetical protein Smp_141810 [Schistosoma mansoni]|uniref:hypothetical protein n=1 Tax=Schistosoma mansoni TaxID=6183 RepID=UPI00022DCA39|nr:hypothetical protein Smp_141810 [Schistosoma mansoni]|eukprot:XP_018654074.1 hypothetical protein Smp_141810 [Schistosoma mansoni]